MTHRSPAASHRSSRRAKPESPDRGRGDESAPGDAESRQAAPGAAPQRTVARAAVAGAAAVPQARSMPRLRLDAASPFMTPPPPPPDSVALVATSGSAIDPARTQLVAAQAAASAAEVALVREQERLQSLEAGITQLRGDAQAQQQDSRRAAGATARGRRRSLRQRPGLHPRRGAGVLRPARGRVLGLAAAPAPARALVRRQRPARPAKPPARRREASGRPDIHRHDAWAQRSASIRRNGTRGPASILPVTAPASIGGLEVTTVLAPQSHHARMAEAGASAKERGPGPGHVAVDGRADRPRAAGRVLRRPRPGRGGDRAARCAPEQTAAAVPCPTCSCSKSISGAPIAPATRKSAIAFQRPLQGLRSRVELGPPLRPSLDEYPQAIAPAAGAVADAAACNGAARQPALSAQRGRRDLSIFPAYRELLFLYSVARELAGNVETDFGSIDLFLPLEDAPTEASTCARTGLVGRPRRLGFHDRHTGRRALIRRSAGRRGAG